MSSFNNYIKFALDIKDQNIVFEDYFFRLANGYKQKIYQAVLLQPSCPFCGSQELRHNGRLKTEIRYPAANASQPVIIRLFKQRVWCRTCNKRSMAQSDLVGKYCCISQHSKLKILSALTEDRSMTSIARENNVSVNTVQRVLGSCSHQFSSSYDYLPEHLAFDEFKGVDRTLHFICLDADKHEVVQILRTRYKKAIIAYFKKFAPAALQGVKTVSLDLNFYYQDIVRACFPNAELVLDRFHMVQMLTRSFNSLRVQVMKKFKKTSREYKLLKSPWKLYLKKYQALDKIHPHYNWHYKDNLTQEQIVNEGIACSTELTNAYNLLQAFYDALAAKDPLAIKEVIHAKEEVGWQMHQTLLTFKHNLKAVINGITLNYSNGCLEGFNRKIKQIERTAFGYANFHNLLTRIRLAENKVKEKEPSSFLAA